MAKSPAQFDIRLKRAYEAHSADDGTRVLIDRLWPRGMTKKAARPRRRGHRIAAICCGAYVAYSHDSDESQCNDSPLLVEADIGVLRS